MRRTLFHILLFVAFVRLTGCGYDDFGEGYKQKNYYPTANVKISELHAAYDGSAYIFTRDVVIAGHITANDASGNLYRVLMLDDGTGAVEIRAGLYDLHNRFPPGRYVGITAKGLAMGRYNGVLQIGLPSDGGTVETAYFGYRALMDKYVFSSVTSGEIPVLAATPGQLEDYMCGRLVRLGPLRYEPDFSEASGGQLHSILDPGDAWTDPGVDTFRIFVDAEGSPVSVLTSRYADFAGEVIPEGAVFLTGILYKGRTGLGADRYYIKLRDHNDVEVL